MWFTRRHFCTKWRIFGTDENSLQNLHKFLDLCGFSVYYMPRYSGIVQSVEQRTVNGQRHIPTHHYKTEIFRRKPPQFWQCVIYDSLPQHPTIPPTNKQNVIHVLHICSYTFVIYVKNKEKP